MRQQDHADTRGVFDNRDDDGQHILGIYYTRIFKLLVFISNKMVSLKNLNFLRDPRIHLTLYESIFLPLHPSTYQCTHPSNDLTIHPQKPSIYLLYLYLYCIRLYIVSIYQNWNVLELVGSKVVTRDAKPVIGCGEVER